jgi:hypothetical protein
MNPRHASAHARRLGRTRSPEMALVREPDAEPCPRWTCRRASCRGWWRRGRIGAAIEE